MKLWLSCLFITSVVSGKEEGIDHEILSSLTIINYTAMTDLTLKMVFSSWSLLCFSSSIASFCPSSRQSLLGNNSSRRMGRESLSWPDVLLPYFLSTPTQKVVYNLTRKLLVLVRETPFSEVLLLFDDDCVSKKERRGRRTSEITEVIHGRTTLLVDFFGLLLVSLFLSSS